LGPMARQLGEASLSVYEGIWGVDLDGGSPSDGSNRSVRLDVSLGLDFCELELQIEVLPTWSSSSKLCPTRARHQTSALLLGLTGLWMAGPTPPLGTHGTAVQRSPLVARQADFRPSFLGLYCPNY